MNKIETRYLSGWEIEILVTDEIKKSKEECDYR